MVCQVALLLSPHKGGWWAPPRRTTRHTRPSGYGPGWANTTRSCNGVPGRRPHHPHVQMELGSLPSVPGRAHRKDAFIAADEQHPFQKPATLIVKEVFIPFVFHELGYDHDDAAIGMLL